MMEINVLSNQSSEQIKQFDAKSHRYLKCFLFYVVRVIYNQMEAKHSHSNSKEHRKRQGKKCRRGGVSDLPFGRIAAYFQYLSKRRQKESHSMASWLPSIQRFNTLIQGDPVLRMNWEYGIFQCNKTLPGKTGNDVFNMVDTACRTPPCFSNEDLVGFPINAIFVEFMQNENGRSFFSDARVNSHLKDIINDYQQLLLSPQSLEFMNEIQPTGWFCKEAQVKIDYSQYICFPEEPHYGFKNWNEWFLRLFKPGERPIGTGSPNGVNHDDIIVNSCESTPLTLPLQPQKNVQRTDQFWLKDDVYSLSDMFAAERFNKHELVNNFVGGTVYQGFLSALFYHRWHAPVAGTIEDIYEIPGTYYLDQSQFIPYDEGSPNNSESFLSAVAARKVVVIKADNHRIGKIAIIYIGMAEVSSCITTVKIGDHVKKGAEIGHFEFGGSSHTIVFEKKANLNFASGLYTHNEQNEIEGVKQNLGSFLAQLLPQ